MVDVRERSLVEGGLVFLIHDGRECGFLCRVGNTDSMWCGDGLFVDRGCVFEIVEKKVEKKGYFDVGVRHFEDMTLPLKWDGLYTGKSIEELIYCLDSIGRKMYARAIREYFISGV